MKVFIYWPARRHRHRPRRNGRKPNGDLSMVRTIIALVGMSLVVGTVSTAALAASKRTDATAESDVRNLLLLMDKDKNGTVSKDEFLQYLSQAFDRLDVNKSGQLERNELTRAKFPFSKRTRAATATDVRQLVRMMDTDKNGTVSKDEFLQFMSQTFDRLDVNKSGELEREELRHLDDPDWIVCKDLGICYRNGQIVR
jgi:Ca2+-binding EF-hand superfamily protein